MWTKISEFYKSNKCAILWTIGYFIATWAIMRFMFNFDIFSRVRWWQLAHAHLHGFPGFVFGILILAAVPMYIATTIIISRTKEPLFTIKIPESVRNFFKNAFTQTPMDEPTPVETPQPEQPIIDTPEPTNKQPSIPDNIPSEMRVAYMHAMEHTSRTPTSAFDLGNVTKSTKSSSQPEPETITTNNDMPIPTDFDIDDVDEVIDSVPQFTDISFGDDDDDDTVFEINDIPEISDTNKIVADYMKSKSVPYTIDNDVIVTDKFAIVSHTDSDFWVADTDNWFAAGKTRKSPIELVKHIADAHNVEPVLYLGADNIMDIEKLIPQWESAGIHIITDLKDLI